MPRHPSQENQMFHGLWSLWDMLEFYAANFLSASHRVSRLCGFAQHAINDRAGFGMAENAWKEHREDAAGLVQALDDLNLPVSKASATRILDCLDSGAARTSGNISARVFSEQQAQRLLSLIDDTNERVSDELGSRFLLSISAEKALFYMGTSSAFGPDVQAKFLSLKYEIDEAGKCFALERSTACAFHSIRCLEAGIRAISRCLQIPDPTKGSQRSWANILRAIKDKMDARWPNQADRFSGDGRLFEDFYASLAAMQNPWRNATMHLDQKYTEGEAKHLMDVIGGFMNRLASRMDESGLPLA